MRASVGSVRVFSEIQTNRPGVLDDADGLLFLAALFRGPSLSVDAVRHALYVPRSPTVCMRRIVYQVGSNSHQ